MEKVPSKVVEALQVARHHITGHLVGGQWRPAKPLKFRGFTGWFRQRSAEARCARTIGHCWHVEHGSMIDWYCCCCGGEIDGNPPQHCRPCETLKAAV